MQEKLREKVRAIFANFLPNLAKLSRKACRKSCAMRTNFCTHTQIFLHDKTKKLAGVRNFLRTLLQKICTMLHEKKFFLAQIFDATLTRFAKNFCALRAEIMHTAAQFFARKLRDIVLALSTFCAFMCHQLLKLLSNISHASRVGNDAVSQARLIPLEVRTLQQASAEQRAYTLQTQCRVQ